METVLDRCQPRPAGRLQNVEGRIGCGHAEVALDAVEPGCTIARLGLDLQLR
jgi:hypothetical protein